MKHLSAASQLDTTAMTTSEDLDEVDETEFKAWRAIIQDDCPGISDPRLWIIISAVLLLLSLAAVMAGLTVGLMSIDNLKLSVIEMTGTAAQKRRVKRLAPLLKQNREQLLISIIIVNCICMEWVPTLLQRIFTETFTLVISVSLVLIFGEILPQVLCLQRPIACGSNFVWLAYVLKVVTFPLAWPLMKCLNTFVQHREKTVMFTSGELDAVLDLLLTELNAQSPQMQPLEVESTDQLTQPMIKKQASVDKDSLTIMKGALRAMWSSVSTISRPMNRVFMLPEDAVANKETMQRILESGHSRIPIHSSKNEDEIRGIVLVKKLVIDYDQSVTPREFRDFINAQPLFFPPSLNVLGALNHFQVGKSHLAFLRMEGSGKLTGMITLEDVIEFLIQEPIGDETDRMDFRSSRFAHTLLGRPYLRSP